jgi:tetratricopeptide (TPR) repeat protein
LNNDLLTTDEELILKRLSDELRRVSKEKEAQTVEALIFKNYPFISQSLRETLVPDTVCRLDAKLEARQNNYQFAAELIQQLGNTEDTKNFAFALVGLADAYRKINYPIDSVSGQQKTELLDLVEWLQSVREYEPALDITNKLILSQSFEPPFTRDRLISLHARNLNGNHRPVEAASFYRNLILHYPETDIANSARPKYVLSLHYAQKYIDVAREASSLAGIVRPRDVSWRTFWAHYLGKNFSLALSTSADDLKKLRQPRFNYWRARAYESDGRYEDAKRVFSQIPATIDSALYALFSQARLKSGPLKPPQSQRSGLSLAARGLHSFELSDTATLRRKKRSTEKLKGFGVLLSAGFGTLVRGPLKIAFDKTGDSDLALALVEAGDAYSVVRRAAYKSRIRGEVPLGKEGSWRGFMRKNLPVMEMLYPLPHADLIADAAEAFSISPWLILGIMRAESLYQPTVVSSVGARGLMQIMPTTGARIAELTGYPNFEPAHLDKPEVSIAFGAWYLARLLNYYDHHLPLAIAGYNAGPEAIDRWIDEKKTMKLDEFLEDIPYEQTRGYVSKVLSNMEIYSRVYSDGARGIRVDPMVSLPEPRKNMEMF